MNAIAGTSRPFHRDMPEPPTGSPNEFRVVIGQTPHLLGKSEAEEALVRVILACQEAGKWVGLEIKGFLNFEIQNFDPAVFVSVLNLGHYGQGLLVDGFWYIEDRGLIRVDRGGQTIIWPTQALVDHDGLQRYR